MARLWEVVSGANSAALNTAILTAFANKKQPCRVIGYSYDNVANLHYALIEYMV